MFTYRTLLVGLFALFMNHCIYAQSRVEIAKIIPPILDLLSDDSGPKAISGVISLPQGVIAGPDGVTLRVSTFPLEIYMLDGFFVLSNDTVTIESGQSSANYSIPLPQSPDFQEKSLEFDCMSGCELLDITTTGFWNESSGVRGSILGTRYSNANHTVDILLEMADVFSGQISLPDGFTASGNEALFVRVRDNGLFGLDSFLQLIPTEAGESSWEFLLGVPTSVSDNGWELEFFCLSCDVGISDQYHFPTLVTGDPATLFSGDAFIFMSDDDYPAISLTLIPVVP